MLSAANNQQLDLNLIIDSDRHLPKFTNKLKKTKVRQKSDEENETMFNDFMSEQELLKLNQSEFLQLLSEEEVEACKKSIEDRKKAQRVVIAFHDQIFSSLHPNPPDNHDSDARACQTLALPARNKLKELTGEDCLICDRNVKISSSLFFLMNLL